MWKKVLSIVLSTLLCCLVFASCKQEDTVITLPVDAIPSSCDPAVSETAAGSTLAANCYEGLVRVDENGNVQKAAADHWSISDDGLTYTFILRDGLTWHVPDADSADSARRNPLGEDFILNFPAAMTADDFVFGIQRAVAAHTLSPGASRLFGIVNAPAVYAGEKKTSALGVSAPDEHSVRIKLSAPDSNFLTALASPCAMPCSRAFFEETAGRYGLSAGMTLCNGPYYVSSYDQNGTSVTMTKNPDYQGLTPGDIDQCVLACGKEVVSDGEEKVIDILSDLRSDEGILDGAILSSAAADSLPRDFETTEYYNFINAVLFNMGSDFSGNEDLRLALTTATDTSMLIADGKKAAEGLIPYCCNSVSGTPYRLAAGTVPNRKVNLKKAKQYLATAREKFEAAATPDEPAPTSFDIRFVCLESDKKPVQSLVQNWQKVFGSDLNIAIETKETETDLQETLVAGAYDVAFAPIHCSELVATNVLKQFSGETDANVVHLASDEYDAFLLGAASAKDPETVTGYCLAAEQYLIKQGILLPVSQGSTLLAVKKKTAGGLKVLPTGDTYLVYLI